MSGLAAHTSRAEAIETSANQSVLSQQILFYGARVSDPTRKDPTDKENLKLSVNQFAYAHRQLTAGESGKYGVLSEELKDLYFKDKKHIKSLDKRSKTYIDLARKMEATPDMLERQAHWRELEELGTNTLLSSLKLASKEFENMAQASVAASKKTANISFIIAMLLLVFEAAFIFLPSHKTISNHVEELRKRHEKEKELNAELARGVAREVEIRRVAQNASKAKTEFLAKMSHELRTPMNGIIGVIDLLKLSGASKEQTQLINIIERSGDNLLSVIDSLLSYSEAASDAINVKSEPFEIKRLISQLDRKYSARCTNKNLRFMTDVEDDFNPELFGDEKLLGETLSCLLENAVNFTTSGKVTLQVRGQEIDNGVNLSLAIIDTGIGIADDKQETIFDNFTQADNSYSRSQDGLGLGLTLAREYARAMSGEISVTSEIDKGSTFTLHLFMPLASAITAEDYDTNVEKSYVTEANDISDEPIKDIAEEQTTEITPPVALEATNDKDSTDRIEPQSVEHYAQPKTKRFVSNRGLPVLLFSQNKDWNDNWSKALNDQGALPVVATSVDRFVGFIKKTHAQNLHFGAIIIDQDSGEDISANIDNIDNGRATLAQSHLILSSQEEDARKIENPIGEIGLTCDIWSADNDIEGQAKLLLELLALPEKSDPFADDEESGPKLQVVA